MPSSFTPGRLAPTGRWTTQATTSTDVRIVQRTTTGWVAQTSADTTQSTSPTLTISPLDNDLVMVGITIDVAAGSLASSVISCNAAQTWTKIGEINDASFTDHRYAWFYRKWQVGDDTALTFTCNVSGTPTAVEWALAAMAYGGTSDVTPIGTYAFNTEAAGANTPTHVSKTIVPAGAGSWVGYFAQDRTGSSLTGVPTGYVNRALARPSGGTSVNPAVNIGDSAKEVVKGQPVTLTFVHSGSSVVAGNIIFEIVAYGQTSNPPPQLSLGPVIGAVTDTSVTVVYGFSGLATTARLAVTTDPTYTTGLTYSSATTQTSNGVCKMTVSGLTADTVYYVAAEGDGSLLSGGRGSFRTDPASGVAANFSLAFSSCQFTVPTSAAFGAIKNRTGAYGSARRLIHMGDMHYRDWADTAVRADVISQWFDTINNSVVANMLSTVPTTYCWDNHDWGGVDSDSTNGAGSAIASAFREMWPHYALPATDSVGAWQTWVIGRVRFIQIDPRSQRVPRTDPESSSKTMLGTEQKAWFKARLQDPEPVKIICGNMYWRSEGGAAGDRWSSYSTEWNELTTFINSTSGVTGRVYVLFGDTHALCADDGSTSTTGGIPQAGGAPLQQGALPTTGETWSQGYYTDETGAVIQCYGWLDITDTGSVITIDYQGITALDGVTQVSMTTTIPTLAGPTAGAEMAVTAALTAGAVVSRPVAAALAVTADLAADTTQSIPAAAAVAAVATLTAAATSSISGAAALAATATLTAAAARTAAADASTAVTATSTASATVTGSGVNAALAATATLTAAASQTTLPAAALAVTATVTATPARTAVSAAALAVTAALSADTTVTRSAAAALAVTATLTAAPARTAASSAALLVTATVTTSAARTAVAVADLSVTVTWGAAAARPMTAAAAVLAIAVFTAAADAAGGVTYRPFTGTTARPYAGVTVRP